MLAEQFDAFLFDLDGVVYIGGEPVDGARDALCRIREKDKELRFLTNDPVSTRSQVVRRLRGMDIEAAPEEIVTSGWATAKYLQANGLGSAYVVGSRGLVSELVKADVEVVDRGDCDAVVVGSDEHVSYAHIRRASQMISRGAQFIATNADRSFPSPQGPLPGTGAIVEAVKISTGEQPHIVGKPHSSMFDAALQGISAGAERTLMLGDTLETDILGAYGAGISGILIGKEGERGADATIRDLMELFTPSLYVDVSKRGERLRFLNGMPFALAAADRLGHVLLVRDSEEHGWRLPTGLVGFGCLVATEVPREVRRTLGVEVEDIRLAGVYRYLQTSSER